MSLDGALKALAAQMSASLLVLSQDGDTEVLAEHVEVLAERVQDLGAVLGEDVPPIFTGWAVSIPQG